MDIKVNIVEISSELAHDKMYEELTSEYLSESDIYKQNSDVVEYTEYAQKVFDSWYDYYYDFIISYSIIIK